MTVTEVKTEAEFDSFVQKSKEQGSVLVIDFSAVWCGPCRAIEPVVHAMSDEFKNAVFIKVDVDQLSAVSSRCGITAMPTFHVYKAGEKVGEVVGANEAGLRKLVTDHSQ